METKAGPKDVSGDLETVQDLVLTMANTVAMFKIFPANHSNVSALLRELWAKLSSYLAVRPALELEIRESAFVYQGQSVYEDANQLKSLPYVFFKDGLTGLSLRQGLQEAEFQSFLELVRADAALPAEDGDLVSALWEFGFPHIGWQTAIDYLEAKTPGSERRPWDVRVDTAAFSQGRLDLAPEDLAAVMKAGLALGMKDGGPVLDPSDLTAPLNKKEVEFVTSLLDIERAIPAEKAFQELFFELLVLEDRPAALATMLQFIGAHHDELVKKGNFGDAALLLGHLEALRSSGAGPAQSKARDIDQIARRIRESVSLTALREKVRSVRMDDPAGFFRYLDRLGGRALPLAADVFEESEDGLLRSAGLAFLKEVGERNLDALSGLANDARPVLSKGLVSILAQMKDRKAIPALAAFKNIRDKSVRLEAVQALAALEDPLAVRILQGYAADPDPEVREAVLRALAAKL